MFRKCQVVTWNPYTIKLRHSLNRDKIALSLWTLKPLSSQKCSNYIAYNCNHFILWPRKWSGLCTLLFPKCKRDLVTIISHWTVHLKSLTKWKWRQWRGISTTSIKFTAAIYPTNSMQQNTSLNSLPSRLIQSLTSD